MNGKPKSEMRKLLLLVILAAAWLCPAAAARAETRALLPDESARTEITEQLLEIATANFDSRFVRQFVRTRNSLGKDGYPRELAVSYLMVRWFRERNSALGWTDRQNFSIPHEPMVFGARDIERYNELVSSGELERELGAMRPEIPYYLDYRREMIAQLRSGADGMKPYRFVVIKEGSSGEAVNALKETLMNLGYLDRYSPLNGTYDIELAGAIRDFQADSGLAADGIVGGMTYGLLFKNPRAKAVSIARTIIRMSDSGLYSPGSYVFVNIPKMEMNVYENGRAVLTSRVVVGRSDRETPRLKSRINNVVLNPTWTAPETILEKDYLPLLKRDRFALAKKGLEIFRGAEAVDPTTLTPEDLSPEGIKRLRIVQKPGTGNTMGKYKFNFPNSESIYLHSTNSPGKFRNSSRMLSSGCVRVQKSEELAKYLLKGAAKPEKIDKILASDDTAWLTPARTVPIYLAYLTAYIGEDGRMYYLPDIYHVDEAGSVLSAEFVGAAR